jgi:starch phosphorylase
MRDFYELWPEKFHNVTNGVTPRRFMVVSNPRLTQLITETCGDDRWVRDLNACASWRTLAEDHGLQRAWRAVKPPPSGICRNWLGERSTGVHAGPETLFDIQAKRIHEYKRQHLNLLHIIWLYEQIKQNPTLEVTPRTFIFGGKAAPGYFMAKLIIKLINAVGEVVNNDPQVNGAKLRVVFMPDFNVKNGQRVYPAADLSEQISMAGKEASGTGNMKFSMNGALTIGTLDGANVEIRDEVGHENFFLFGLTAEEVRARPRCSRPSSARVWTWRASTSPTGASRTTRRRSGRSGRRPRRRAGTWRSWRICRARRSASASFRSRSGSSRAIPSSSPRSRSRGMRVGPTWPSSICLGPSRRGTRSS